ncbi:N-acetylmuramoyl-L-alanine amidase [Thermoanaerobacteraceae bacterium SP2]|jgi:N-acetylmuramoyl-L-alanine amidase|nr:N-acetylmuramoyl-L-alanine amidase [Thermoanaerobacteraceae bacterium]RKL64009.1 N-acetylmuramoyl-L-alanine amidase [Thermoanaerobacteraceae bacterium SP2]
MKRGLTNVYVKTDADFSTMIMESTMPLSHALRRSARNVYEFSLDGGLIMAPDTINIYDGLINTVKVAEQNGGTLVSVALQYPSSYRLKQIRGIPDRLEICFDRAYIKNVMRDKLVIIDSGHGGGDIGRRGYINLLEKNVVMHISGFMKSKIINTGARAVLTREKDISMGLKDRLEVAGLLEADLWISIHTRWDRVKNSCGAAALYHSKPGELLCRFILEELGKKLKLENKGVHEESFSKGFDAIGTTANIPFVTIEVCTISNPVEEGWLRSPVFKERTAQAITNGIVRYYDSNRHERDKNIFR